MNENTDGQREAYCRSCKAPIVWVKGAEPGKWHITNPPRKMFVQTGQGFFELRDCYESHFSTCPDAKGWRKPRPTKTLFTMEE
jgi:hypothetical protein